MGLIVIVLPLAFLPASMGPFVDVKLVVLAARRLVLWTWTVSGTPNEGRSRLAVPAAAWAGIVALAGFFGVDKWWSLLGPENMGNGLLLLGASAFLLVVATKVPAAVRARVPGWLVGVSTVVACTGLLSRFWPQLPVPGGMALSLAGPPSGTRYSSPRLWR